MNIGMSTNPVIIVESRAVLRGVSRHEVLATGATVVRTEPFEMARIATVITIVS